MESLHNSAPRQESSGEATGLAGNLPTDPRPRSDTGEFGSLRPADEAAVRLLSPQLAGTLLTAATTGSVALSSNFERADGSSLLPEGTGIWISGNLGFGTRKETSDGSGLRFTTDGISVGIDRWFSEALVLGVGFGYAWDTTDIDDEGTKNSTNGWSLSAYASYQPTQNTFIDGLIGYGDLNMDTARFVPSVAAFAQSGRDGDQVFGSLSAGYEYRNHGVLLSPYGRLDFSLNSLDETTEIGAGLNALTYEDEDLDSGQLSLGLRAESRHEMSFGWVVPRVRVEYNYNFEGSRRTQIAYADQIGGPRFSLSPDSADRHTLLVSAGSDFDFRNGVRLGVDYQSVQASGADEIQAFGLWLSTDLDGRAMTWGPLATRLFENPVRIETSFTWDDNLNRASEGPDKLSDHVYSLNVTKSMVFPVTTHTRLRLNGYLNGTKMRKHDGLDRISASLRGEFQYRPSSDFSAPTFGIFARTSVEEYDSALRSGYRYAFGVNARKSFTDRIGAFGAFERTVREGDSPVFQTKDYAARVNIDYSLGRHGVAYVGGEYRDGDTVSSIDSASPVYLNLADVSEVDDAYHNIHLEASRYEAETWLFTLGYNWFLGPRDSIDFSWRYASSSPSDSPSDGSAASPSYSANQLSVAYLMRF